MVRPKSNELRHVIPLCAAFLATGCAPVLHVRTAELARPGHLRVAGATSVMSENVTTRTTGFGGREALTDASPTVGWDALELAVGAGVADRIEVDVFGGLARQALELRVAILEERRGDFISLAAGIAGGSALRWGRSTILFDHDPRGVAPFGRLALDASVRPVPWLILIADYAFSAGPWTAGQNTFVSDDEVRVQAGLGIGLGNVPDADGSGVRFVLGVSVESRLFSLGHRELGIGYTNPAQYPLSANDGLAFTLGLGVEGVTGRL